MPLANQPISLLGSLILNLLLDHDPENIRYVLVEGSRLAVVVERAGVLGDSVSQLVPDNIDAASEVVEELAAVAEHHLKFLWVPDWNSQPCPSPPAIFIM